MNDPIKDFVEQHRGEFDHLEAPVFQLDQLKKRIQAVPEVRKRSFSMLNGNKWLVAASILMTLTCAWFFFYSSDQEDSVVKLARHKQTSATGANVTSGSKSASRDSVADNSVFIGKPLAKRVAVADVNSAEANINNTKLGVEPVGVLLKDGYARLKDSTSASSRLLAILEIEKEDRIDDELLQMLALTLNHDKNTNVRLAALSLLEKVNHDGYVSSLLVSSLDKQDDPIVQLGLMSILGNMENVDIDDKLESLASSPDTFAAVRDEAYSILLKQNKL
jgi:hypothetical protein